MSKQARVTMILRLPVEVAIYATIDVNGNARIDDARMIASQQFSVRDVEEALDAEGLLSDLDDLVAKAASEPK